MMTRSLASVLSLTLSVVFSAGAQDLSIADVSVGNVGSRIQLPVRINTAPNLVDAYGFDVTYDSTVLEFNGFSDGPLTSDFSFTGVSNPSAGSLIAAGFTFGAGTEIDAGASGTLLVLRFTILACPVGSSPLALSDLVDDVSGWTIQNGSYSCGSVMNTAPVASDSVATTDEDQSVTLSLSATDSENDPLTFSIVSGPSNGTLGNLTGNQVTYTPDQDFYGSDSIMFSATDGEFTSNTGRVDITIDPINDAPEAADGLATTDEDLAVTLRMAATDIEGDSLSFTIVGGPSNGSLGTVTGDQVLYTPDADFAGADAIQFVAHDGEFNSNTGMIAITVDPINDAPEARDGNATTNEDVGVTITLDATDVDSDPLSFTIVAQPTHGSLGFVTNDQVTYTPDPDFEGSDTLTFFASDASENSNVATVTIVVDPVNDAPVAENRMVATPQATPITVTMIAMDIDGDPLSYTIVDSPTNGALGSVAGEQVVYTPNGNFVGVDAFTFFAHDGTENGNVASVSITVSDTNLPPVAENVSTTTDEDRPVTVTFDATDPDGDPVTFKVVSSPLHGTLGGVTGDQIEYTPNPDFNGSDAFDFVSNDGEFDGNASTVTITVVPVNDAPTVSDDTATTDEDTAIVIALIAVDIDGDALSYSIGSAPANGTLSAVNEDEVTYTPNADFNGLDSFTFMANDATASSGLALIAIAVTAVNDPPVSIDQTVNVDEDASIGIVLSAADDQEEQEPIVTVLPDGTVVVEFPLAPELMFSIIDGPANGTLSELVGDGLEYTPDPNFNGQDSFIYRVNDGVLDSTTDGTIIIDVAPVNDAPVTHGQFVETDEDVPILVTLIGSDIDGDLLNFMIDSSPLNGSLSAVNGNEVTYTPNENFFGSDRFDVIASDGMADGIPATIEIVVAEVIDCVVSVADVQGSPGEFVMIDVLLALAPELDSYQFDLQTDPNVLLYTGSFTAGDLVVGFDVQDVTDQGSGLLVITGAAGTGARVTADASGTLISIAFEVLACPQVPAKGPAGVASIIEIVDPRDDLTGCAIESGAFSCANRPPPTDAGEDVDGAVVGDKVNLDGSSSFDPDGDIIAFSWILDTVPENSGATIENGQTPNPCFTPDVAGIYVICLTVVDGEFFVEDCVTVVAVDAPVPCPIADAGADQAGCTSLRVTLDGSGSAEPEPGPTALGFLWTFDASPEDSTAILEDASTDAPSFIPDLPGVYTLRLDVFDGNGVCDNPEAAVDFVDIVVTRNTPPNAVAGTDQEVTLGNVVLLDGTGSNDPDGIPEPLSFSWSFVSLPPSSALNGGDLVDPDTALASFSPDIGGVFVLRLEISDGKDTAGDNVMVIVSENIKQDVTEFFDIVTSNGQSILDPVAGTIISTKDLTLTNTSQTEIFFPAQVIVPIAGQQGAGPVQMPDATGVNADGDIYFELGDLFAIESIGAGDSITFELRFEYPIGTPVIFDVSVCGFILEVPMLQ